MLLGSCSSRVGGLPSAETPGLGLTRVVAWGVGWGGVGRSTEQSHTSRFSEQVESTKHTSYKSPKVITTRPNMPLATGAEPQELGMWVFFVCRHPELPGENGIYVRMYVRMCLSIYLFIFPATHLSQSLCPSRSVPR